MLAETFQFDLPEGRPDVPSLVDTWVRVFSGYEMGQLNRAFERLLATWKPEFGRKFPAPGDLTAILAGARQLQLADEAEQAWHSSLAAINDNYHPDLGWRGPSGFNASTENAVRAAGGVHSLFMGSDRELVWAKKAFIEAYLREDRLETARPLLPELQALLIERKS